MTITNVFTPASAENKVISFWQSVGFRLAAPAYMRACITRYLLWIWIKKHHVDEQARPSPNWQEDPAPADTAR